MSFGGSAGTRIQQFGDFFNARWTSGARVGDGEGDADHRAIAEWDDDAAADEFFAIA